MLHRRQLPILSPCEEFVGRVATAGEPAFCSRCTQSVHDLSSMRPRELVEFLRRHRGQDVCVSYRTRPDGAIVLRPDRPPLGPVAFALSLAACAGHLGEAPADHDDCIDAAGYAVPCPSERWSDAVAPDELAATPGGSGDTNVAPAAARRTRRAENEEFARYEFAPEGDPDAPPFVDYRRPATPEPSVDDAPKPSSCKITKRVRRRAERDYYGDAGVEDGKLAPLTDARICEIEEHLRQARRPRRAR